MQKRWEQPKLDIAIGLANLPEFQHENISPKCRKEEVKVTGKWIDGWLFKTPKLSVEVLAATSETKYMDISVSMAVYRAAKEGSTWIFTFKQDDNGSWHVV